MTIWVLRTLSQHQQDLFYCWNPMRKLFLIIKPPFNFLLFTWISYIFICSQLGRELHFETIYDVKCLQHLDADAVNANKVSWRSTLNFLRCQLIAGSTQALAPCSNSAVFSSLFHHFCAIEVAAARLLGKWELRKLRQGRSAFHNNKHQRTITH